MRALLVVAALLGALSHLTAADKPDDLPCVTWEPLNEFENTDPTDLFLAAYTWVYGDGQDDCLQEGDIFPCFASDSGVNTWGHHDYLAGVIDQDSCHTYYQGDVYYSFSMYVPKKGPNYTTWKWVLAQSGGPVPDNAIRFGDSVMARSTETPPGYCCGKGFVGWALGQPNGTFGPVYFSIWENPVVTDTFEVAVCEAYHPTTTTTTTTPAPTTTTTTSAPTTPSPTLPPNNKPYIRFAYVVPSSNNIFATITQQNGNGSATSYTWSNIQYPTISTWVEIFAIGFGTIDVYAATASGQRGAKLVTKTIQLTPGPLVVAVMGYWPPTDPVTAIETIAASYIPFPDGTSGVRLFNLSPDTHSAGMSVNGVTKVDGIIYTLGSEWVAIPAGQSMVFSAFDDTSKTTLASDTFAGPPSPRVFTNFLVGLKNASSSSTYRTQLLPRIDAPE